MPHLKAVSLCGCHRSPRCSFLGVRREAERHTALDARLAIGRWGGLAAAIPPRITSFGRSSGWRVGIGEVGIGGPVVFLTDEGAESKVAEACQSRGAFLDRIRPTDGTGKTADVKGVA